MVIKGIKMGKNITKPLQKRHGALQSWRVGGDDSSFAEIDGILANVALEVMVTAESERGRVKQMGLFTPS